MPWVNPEMCTGCVICVGECPVGAISVGDSGCADIDEDACIRCGKCHDVCPQDAVRHDGERIPLEIANNLEWTLERLEHFNGIPDQRAFLERAVRYFNKQRKVAEKTIEILEDIGDGPPSEIHHYLHQLRDSQRKGPR